MKNKEKMETIKLQKKYETYEECLREAEFGIEYGFKSDNYSEIVRKINESKQMKKECLG